MNKRLCGRALSSWSMEDQIQPLDPIELMYRRHQGVLVVVVDLYAGKAWFL